MVRVVGVGVGLWLCSSLWLPAVRGIARWATIYLPYISAAALVASAAVHIPYSRIPTLRILRPASGGTGVLAILTQQLRKRSKNRTRLPKPVERFVYSHVLNLNLKVWNLN